VTSENGIPIVGGHSFKSDEPFYGLSVTGTVEISKMMTNTNSRPGDYLYLTKPIGSGLITTGLKQDKARPEFVAKAVEIMAALNKDAAEAAAVAGVTAATDVTGYGLLGHLLEMMLASKTSAEINIDAVPLMEGVLELAELQTFPGGTGANLLYVDKSAIWDEKIELNQKRILCDAQTSGGLILSVNEDKHETLERELSKRGIIIARVGEVAEEGKWPLKVNKN
jgi:selenide,water dikinase